MVAHIAKADGLITDAENDAVGAWLNDWLDRSYWGGCYTSSKARALEQLCAGLMTDGFDFIVCCDICCSKLSKSQMQRLLETVEKLEKEGSEAQRKTAAEARQALTT